MLTVTNVSLRFSDRKLFEDVNIKFTPGNCYGIIGANGAGKSTFLRILSGALEPTTGEISIGKNERMSVLKQDHYAFDEYTALDTVILGNPRLYEIGKEKDALYMKEDFSEEDGILASELESEFAELGGWEAESDAAKLLQSLGIPEDLHNKQMDTLSGAEKVKVILAQALFGNPDILILDEPTNDLDIASISWLEEFLIDFQGIVIVVSHDRHFLNNVCTMMADVDYGKIKVYPGNYDFWYQSSQLAMQLAKDQNRKKEEKIKELESFVARFSANASKSKQATSRKKMLEKITLDDIPATSRRYPFVGFTKDREVGNDILRVNSISKTLDDELLLKDVSFTVQKGDKIAVLGREQAVTALFQIIMGELEPDTGDVNWGVTITNSYFPRDNSAFFDENDHINLVDWLRQYSPDPSESFIRGFLGRMLFSGEEVFKDSSVLSGGEKVRLMLSRMMMKNANLLVLDQPTNHLDLESITALNNGLQDFDSNILFSSHDHEFIQTIANRIIQILPDGTILDKSMSYDEFLAWKTDNNA